jgi:hypothetical protein
VANIKGGDKFEHELRKIATLVSKPATLRVGFLEKAKYPDGTPVAMVAAIQNFGAPRARIPPRPFFGNMIARKKREWPKAVAGLLKAHGYDAAKALDEAGFAIAGQLRQAIVETNAPPLSPVTLMLRKMQGEGVRITRRQVGIAAARVAAGESTSGVSTKPLVWSSHMINSVDHEVAT